MFQKITRRNLEKFLEKYRSDKKTLDIGSGGSSYGKFFPNRLTVDIDPMRKPEIVADVHCLPFKNEEFEMVLCTEVLEHTKNPQLAVNEMMRVLKKNGLIVLTTRFVYPLHDSPNDFFRFTKYGLRELFKNWEVVDLVPEVDNFSAIGVLLQRISFQSNLRFNKISKLIILIMAEIFDKLNFLTVKEYGDIQKSFAEKNIMTSGYYIVVRK